MVKNLNLDEIPAGRLMAEHRLIQRILLLIGRAKDKIIRDEKPDMVFIAKVIDFFDTYAHRCHYGKEEDLLFQSLYKKSLRPDHKKAIDDLVLEHIQEKRFIAGLEIAKEAYWKGRTEAQSDIAAYLQEIVAFYPAHMEKEEEFFLPAMEYFSEEEQQNLLRRFDEFDRTLIHGRYIRMAEDLEKPGTWAPASPFYPSR